MKRTLRKVLSMLLIATMVLNTGFITASASEENLPATGLADNQSTVSDTPDTFVALGDSISTGYGLAGYTPPSLTAPAYASESFVELLKTNNQFIGTNLALDGLTSAQLAAATNPNLLNGTQKAILQNASMISVTIGGNDLLGAFYTAMANAMSITVTPETMPAIMAAIIAGASGIPGTETQARQLFMAISSVVGNMTTIVGNFGTQLTTIITNLKTINPTAVIVLQTIANPYKDVPNQSISGFLSQALDPFNTAITNGAMAGYMVADVSAAFEASAEVLTNATNPQMPLDPHPNAAGHKVIADLVFEQWESSFRKTERTTPLKLDNYEETFYGGIWSDAIDGVSTYIIDHALRQGWLWQYDVINETYTLTLEDVHITVANDSGIYLPNPVNDMKVNIVALGDNIVSVGGSSTNDSILSGIYAPYNNTTNSSTAVRITGAGSLTVNSNPSEVITQNGGNSIDIPNGSLTIENATVQAMGTIFVNGNITVSDSKVHVVSTHDAGILTQSGFTISSGEVYAKGGTGKAAIAAQVIKGQDQTEPKAAIVLGDSLSEMTGGKIAVSEWFALDGQETSWTSFVSKQTEEPLKIDLSNALNEVSISLQPKHTDADLLSLTIGNAVLSPAFDSTRTSYTAAVDNNIRSVTVTPTVKDTGNATVTVNGVKVASGSASGAINLNEGSNMIVVEVTAEDGKTTKTYTINLTRKILSSIAVTTPPKKIAYKEGEKFSTTGLSVTATYSDNSKKAVTNYRITPSGSLRAGTTSITITYAEGTHTKTTTQSITVSPKIGTTFTDGSYTYKITDAKTNGKGTAALTGIAKGKTVKNLKVAKTANYKGFSYKVTSIADYAFYNSKTLTNATIGNHVSKIGYRSFKKCSKLKTVSIGSSVTEIKRGAFYKCSNLTTAAIGKNVKTIGKYAFASNPKLKKITIKTTKLTSKNVGKYAFSHLKNTTIKVPSSKYKAYQTMFKTLKVDRSVKITK